MADDLPDAPWAKKADEGLPDAPWAKGGDFSWSKAITDVPSEIASEAKAGWEDVKALGRRGEMGAVEGLMSVPKAVMGAARIPLSPLTGTARSVIGHGMANLEHRAGELIAPEIAAKDDPQKMYEAAKGDVDKAMSAMAARRPVPASGPIPAPPRTIGDFDIPLTEGEAARDVGRIAQERRALRSDAEGQRAHEVARERFADRDRRIEEVRGEIGETFDPARQTIAETPHQAAELAGQSLGQTARDVRDLSRARYEEMRSLPGEFQPEAFTGIGTRIRNDLTHGATPVIIDERTTPIAARAIQDIDEQIGHLRIQNLADPRGAPDPMDIVGINLNGVDQARKRLITFYQDARGFPPTPDQRAMQAILRSFDDQVENAIARGLFSGDERALDALREARGLHSYYKRMFSPQGAGDDVGQAMQRILGRDGAREPATPTEIANMLYGSSSVGAKGLSYRLAERVRQVLGERSPEWAGVKQGLWRRLTEAPEGKTDWGPEKVANRIAEFLNGDGRATAERMFTAGERDTMRRFADVLRQTVPPPGAVNYSNNVPMIAQVRDGLTKFLTAEIGAMLGGIPGAIAGWAAGTVGKPIADIAKARRIRQSMPTIQESVARWDRQIEAHLNGVAPSGTALSAATTNLVSRLKSIGAPEELIGRIRQAAANYSDQGNRSDQPSKSKERKPEQFHGGSVNRASGGKVAAEKALPADHELGMRVPKGGSSCANCRFLSSPTTCGNRAFVKWNGAAKLPAPADSYCCDLYEHKISRASGGAVHNHNPTEAQKEAGNYAKTHKYFQGLDITLENLKGKPRSGIGRDGKKWSVKMPADYGYIKRTEGADGDHVDCYIGPNDKSDQVFVVDQKDAETGKFDEHKCLLGFSSEAEARKIYRAGFSDGKDRIKHLRRMTMDEFKEWLEKGDTSKEIRNYARGGAVRRALQSLKEYADGGAAESTGPFGYADGGAPDDIDWNTRPRVQMVVPDRADEGAPSNPALWGVGADEMPSGIGMGPLARGIGHIAKSIFWDTPKALIDAAKTTPYGIRREDYTDIPADTSPDPNSPLGGIGIAVPRGEGSHLDPMIRPSLETAMNVMGGTSLSAPKGGVGAGPALRRNPALDMSEEARMARAAEQGYTIDAYKGGQPYDWNTMPVKNGRGEIIEGADRVPVELTSINSPNAPYAGFFSNDPKVANRFAEPFEHGAVWPSKLKFENPLVIDAKGERAAAFQFDSIARERGTQKQLDQFKSAFGPDSKYDGVILKNTKDEGTVYIPRDPDQARSRFAAFDPANKGSGVFLGAGAADKRGAVAAAAPVWRSAVEDAIETLPMKAAPADQWANTLRNAKGIKPEEMEWLGLSDFFAAKKAAGEKVTKQELMDHVAGNKVELKDKVSGSHPDADKMMELDARARHLEAEGEVDEARAIREQIKAFPPNEGFRPKYSSYQLPGGENYREHLLTMPQKMGKGDLTGAADFAKSMREKYGERWIGELTPAENARYDQLIEASPKLEEGYKSPHWDEPNVLAHVRTNDRVMETPEGPKKTLHLEEIQSDWHQKGRKLGYREGEPKTTPKLDANDLRIEQDQYQYIGHAPDGRITRVGKGTVGSEEEAREYIARYMNKNAAEKNMEIAQAHSAKVPSAPFKDTDAWAGLAMKRMIREAAEKGYDRISWTPGEAQAARYDLSKQVDNIQYAKSKDGSHVQLEAAKDGNHVFSKRVPTKDLADHVGKELAEKIEKNHGELDHSTGYRDLSGVDLKVGGEGMHEFYDKMLPKIAEKIGKAHGVKVHKGEINKFDPDKYYDDLIKQGYDPGAAEDMLFVAKANKGGGSQPVWYFDITPALKEQALKGMSMFKRGGRVQLPKASDRSVALKLAYQTKGRRNG